VNRGIGIRALNFGREAQTKAHAWGVNEAPVGMPVAACRSRWSEPQSNFWRNNGDSLPQPFTPRLEDYLSTKRAAESGAGRC